MAKFLNGLFFCLGPLLTKINVHSQIAPADSVQKRQLACCDSSEGPQSLALHNTQSPDWDFHSGYWLQGN